MSRLARIVVPGLPHHVTQRGNRRHQVFFETGDYELYRNLLARYAQKHGVEVWAWCLMPNHVHLILVPSDSDGLALAVGGIHRRYTYHIHTRSGWVGHLFQSRFASVVMDERHLRRAIRYVSLNPVRARLVKRAEDWPWSSVQAHLAEKDDRVVKVLPVLQRMPDFAQQIACAAEDDERYDDFRRAECTGRPLGDRAFVNEVGRKIGRPL